MADDIAVDHEALVREVAASLGLLDSEGRLQQLDSLTLMDFVSELEISTGLLVPLERVRTDTFSEVSSVAQLLLELSG